MRESADCSDLPPAPSETITERKIALDGQILEFPLERWLTTPEVIVGRWVADKDPRAISRYPSAGGFTRNVRDFEHLGAEVFNTFEER